eukprot:353618-Chlamydomonas_euryale.AAC.9
MGSAHRRVFTLASPPSHSPMQAHPSHTRSLPPTPTCVRSERRAGSCAMIHESGSTARGELEETERRGGAAGGGTRGHTFQT